MQSDGFITITDDFLSWGTEGIVTLLVQSVMHSALQRQSPFRSHKTQVITLRQVQEQMLEWLTKHSFPSELIAHCHTLLKQS